MSLTPSALARETDDDARARRRARLCVLGAAVLWSTAGAAIKVAVGLNTWQVAGGRGLVAALVVAAFLPSARRGLSRMAVAVGVVYALTTVLFVIANRMTTAANAIFLQDVAPLWVLLLSPLLLRESPTRTELRLVPLYLGGAALFFVDELGPGGAAGNAVAVASGVAFALLFIGLRKLRDGGAESAILAGNLIAFAICLPGAVGGPVPGLRDLVVLGWLGAFQLGLAYILMVRGLKHLSAVEASLLALVEPVLNPVWAFIFAGERPGPFAMAGGAVILAATCARIFVGERRPGRSAA